MLHENIGADQRQAFVAFYFRKNIRRALALTPLNERRDQGLMSA
jgi:hypothetical protein